MKFFKNVLSRRSVSSGVAPVIVLVLLCIVGFGVGIGARAWVEHRKQAELEQQKNLPTWLQKPSVPDDTSPRTYVFSPKAQELWTRLISALEKRQLNPPPAQPPPVPLPPPENPPQPPPAPVTPKNADLTVKDVSFSPKQVKPGDKISVTFTIVNQGTAASVPFHNRISLATTVYGTDISLGNYAMGSIEAGKASDPITIPSITIPPTVSPGIYYVTVYADGFTEVDELEEMNNIGSASSLNVSIPAEAAPLPPPPVPPPAPPPPTPKPPAGETWKATLVGTSKTISGSATFNNSYVIDFTVSGSLAEAARNKGYVSGQGVANGGSTVVSQSATSDTKVNSGSISNLAVEVSAPHYGGEIWIFSVNEKPIVLYTYTWRGTTYQADGYKGFVLLPKDITDTKITGDWRTSDISGFSQGTLSGTFVLTKQ